MYSCSNRGEIVIVQCLASMRRNSQPSLLEHEVGSPDQVPHTSEPVFDQTPKLFDVESNEKEDEESLLK